MLNSFLVFKLAQGVSSRLHLAEYFDHYKCIYIIIIIKVIACEECALHACNPVCHTTMYMNISMFSCGYVIHEHEHALLQAHQVEMTACGTVIGNTPFNEDDNMVSIIIANYS